jgi:hypothetical protein
VCFLVIRGQITLAKRRGAARTLAFTLLGSLADASLIYTWCGVLKVLIARSVSLGRILTEMSWPPLRLALPR